LIAAVIFVMFIGTGRPAAASSPVTITVDADPTVAGAQSSRTVAQGSNFSVNINIGNVTDLEAFNFELQYNQAVISAPTISSGPDTARNPSANVTFLSSTGRTWACSPPNPSGDTNPDPTIGVAFLSCYSTGSSSGPSSSSENVLATVQFNALALGSSSLTLLNVNTFKAGGVETGSCNPTVTVPATCSGATIIVGPPQTDLSVSKTASPSPAKMGNALTYTATATNLGPSAATGVALTDTLPAGVTFGSATPSQGSCSQAAGLVTCALGSIADGGNAAVTIIVTPTTGNPLINTAAVSGNESDPNSANNTVTITTPALWKCTKSDSTVVYRPWISPPGDDDCDGFKSVAGPGGTGEVGSRAPESFIGTDATKACAATPAANDEPLPDAWPMDFNDDQKVDMSDVLHYSSVFKTTQGGPPGPGGGSYAVRYDLNGDGKIDMSDILHFVPFFYKSCAP
jgi:uncharacterized repeat protein (TIGR01451 family)